MDFLPRVVVPATPSSRAHWFVCAENALLLRREGVGLAQLPTRTELERLGVSTEQLQMVGTLDGEDVLALPWTPEHTVPHDFELVGLRALWSRLDESHFAIAGRANQLAHFALTHRFCGRCGAKTERHGTERAFRCPSCALVTYPRISPAIITLVRRGDEALLANSGRFRCRCSARWPASPRWVSLSKRLWCARCAKRSASRWATCATSESQPWPFPHSLMVGFTADWVAGDIRVDGEEIKEARFFQAHALPRIPPRLSIAWSLINGWVRDVTGADAPSR